MNPRKQRLKQLEDLYWAGRAKALGLSPAKARKQAQIDAEVVARTTRRLFREPEKAIKISGLRARQTFSLDSLSRQVFADLLSKKIFDELRRSAVSDDRVDVMRWAFGSFPAVIPITTC